MSTIKDVAKYANVSIGTVSKYINGKNVRAENKKNIEEAIHVLNYRINASARTLKTNKTNTIAILLDDIAGSYYPLIVKEMELALYHLGYTALIIISNHDKQMERKKIELMLEKMVDAFIIFPIDGNPENYDYILSQNVPICIVDLHIPGLSCPQIVSDNIMATYDATTKLLNKNHRNIAIITGPASNTTASDRLKGYILAHESFGLPVRQELIITNGFDTHFGYEGLNKLLSLSLPPTALITCNHKTTYGAVQAILSKSIKIPTQLDMIGFDYISLPQLTSLPIPIITQSINNIAKTVADCIINQINNPELMNQPVLHRIKTVYHEYDASREFF